MLSVAITTCSDANDDCCIVQRRKGQMFTIGLLMIMCGKGDDNDDDRAELKVKIHSRDCLIIEKSWYQQFSE